MGVAGATGKALIIDYRATNGAKGKARCVAVLDYAALSSGAVEREALSRGSNLCGLLFRCTAHGEQEDEESTANHHTIRPGQYLQFN